jgi:hypothetical protein
MRPQDTPAPDERPDETPKRKEYEKPELQVYGDLAEITKAAMGSNAGDGGSHPNKHFTS